LRSEGVHQRYLQGWQPGLVAVVIALAGALLAVPWRAPPVDLPLPLPDGRELSRAERDDRARAAAIAPALAAEVAKGVGGPLFDLRALGEAFRAYGRADAAHDADAALAARRTLFGLVPAARAGGDDRVLSLRAYQTERFLLEVQRWEATGQKSEELIELGGGFIELVERHGWVSAERRISMNAELRAIFFKRRWNEVVALAQPPFSLSLPELQAVYAHLFTHPWQDGAPGRDPASARRGADTWLLRKVDELSRIDPTYPAMLARAVLYYRLGDFGASERALRAQLILAPDGPYALRTRNYFKEVSERASVGSPLP
jgi:hypothetical protein